MATSLITNVILGTARLDGSIDRGVVVSIGGGTGDDDGAVPEERSGVVAADWVLFRV